MKDPLLMDAWRTDIPYPWKQRYEKNDGSWDPCKSLTEAHDRIRKLTNANNGLLGRLEVERKKLKDAKRELRIVSLLVSPTLAVLLSWAIKHIF